MVIITDSNNYTYVGGDYSPADIANMTDEDYTTHSSLGYVLHTNQPQWISANGEDSHTGTARIKFRVKLNGSGSDNLTLTAYSGDSETSPSWSQHYSQTFSVQDTWTDFDISFNPTSAYYHLKIQMTCSDTSRFRALQVYEFEFGTPAGNGSGGSGGGSGNGSGVSSGGQAVITPHNESPALNIFKHQRDWF